MASILRMNGATFMADVPMTVFVIQRDPERSQRWAEAIHRMKLQVALFSSVELFLDAAREPGVVMFGLLPYNVANLRKALLMRGIFMPIIVVANAPSVRLTVAAMKAGAITVLPEPLNDEDAWLAIREATARYASGHRHHHVRREARARLQKLTPGEALVLKCLMSGLPAKRIAKELDVSIRTVESRKRRIIDKTHSGSFAQLLEMVFQAGWPDISDQGLESAG